LITMQVQVNYLHGVDLFELYIWSRMHKCLFGHPSEALDNIKYGENHSD
jgi:hypothetical protein